MSFHPVLSHCHQRFSLYLRGNPIAKVCRLSTGYVLHTNILFPIINSSYSQPNASLPHHTEGRCEVTERYFYLVNCRLFTYTSHSKINDFVGAVILGQTTPIFNITCLSLSISLPGSSPDIPLPNGLSFLRDFFYMWRRLHTRWYELHGEGIDEALSGSV